MRTAVGMSSGFTLAGSMFAAEPSPGAGVGAGTAAALPAALPEPLLAEPAAAGVPPASAVAATPETRTNEASDETRMTVEGARMRVLQPALPITCPVAAVSVDIHPRCRGRGAISLGLKRL